MIIRARSLLTMDGPPIANGAVAIVGNKIADVGTYEDVRRRNSGSVTDLGERTLLPGLINAHCHLDYTCLRGSIAPQASFTSWVREINARKAALTPDDYLRSIADGFAEAARFGTTTIANLEAFPELLRRMPSAPLRTWWFAELIDVRDAISAEAIYRQMCDDLAERGDRLSRIGFAPHAPFTASAKLYRDCAETAARENLPLTTHLAESREEMQMFRDARGPLFDFMQTIGRAMHDCGKDTPIGAMLSRGSLDERWLFAHLNEITEGDFRQLPTAPKFSIVHCPRSHAYFGHSRFPLQRLRALGFNVCIGTDSLASNDDLSLLAELRRLATTEPATAPAELLAMVTTQAADALGAGDSLGRIASGFAADLIAIPTSTDNRSAAEEVLACDAEVPWMMIDGREQTRV